MTRLLNRWRRRWLGFRLDQGPDLLTDRSDPTRPGAARVRDGVPIAHDGPPGFPGRPAVPGDVEAPGRARETRR